MRKSKAFGILVLLLIVSAVAFSQPTTNSPYSKYGLGVLRPETFSQNFALGGVGIGLRSDRNIGYLNPASYSDLVVTTFDVSYTNNALWLKDGSESQYQNNPYIDHIAFAVPVVKNIWGMSFGVLPFSNTGYIYDEVIDDPIAGNVSMYNEGEGAINKAYLGNALGFKFKSNIDPFALILKPFERPKKYEMDSLSIPDKKKKYMVVDSTASLSFGANTYFLFGSMNYDQKVIYGDLANSYNIWKVKDVSVADLGVDLGLQYQKKFKRINPETTREETYKLTFGATYDLAADMNGKRTELTRTFSGSIDFGTVKDTTEFIDDVDNIIQLPSEMGFGISLEKENKWLIAIDYKTANWASILSADPLYSYKSNYSLAAGFEFVPKNDGRGNLFQRMAYRFGTRYATSYLQINNIDWAEYGITFGVGVPVRNAGTDYPRLNLGFEYGKRGTTDGGLIQENFLNFNIGVTVNSVWFQKRKYD